LGLATALTALAFALPASAGAAFPGRNGRIAYAGEARGVYTVRPDGTGRRLILRNGPTSPVYLEPAYARRGARIAFSRSITSPLGPGTPIGSIWLARSDGSHRRQLIAAGPFGSLSSPHWAPDGRRIVFYRAHPCDAFNSAELACPPEVQRSTDYGLFVYRRGRTRLLTHDGNFPSWSPNGRLIAFVSQLREEALYVIRPDGSGRRRIFNRVGVVSVDWSPSGRRLVIGYGTEPGRRIATVRADGRGFRRLARNGFGPAYSPDGRQIVFARETVHGVFLTTMRADGKRQRRIRLPSGRAIQAVRPAWQPLPRRRHR